MSKLFHPLLALMASASDRELAKYVEYLKEENKILRARIPGQVHTTAHERSNASQLLLGRRRAREALPVGRCASSIPWRKRHV